MKQSPEQRQWSESFCVAALLAVAGGFLDAHTYLGRGGVFANAQTGNLVLLAVRAAEGRWSAAGGYLAPIAAFSMGVLVTELLKRRLRQSQTLHWRQLVLALEMAVLVCVSALPLGRMDGAANVLVSFVCALQVETFRKVRGNPFASTMCTGNLRSCMETLYRGVSERDGALLKKSGCYFGVITCFLLGAALGGVLTARFPQRSILAAGVFLLAAFGVMWRKRK